MPQAQNLPVTLYLDEDDSILWDSEIPIDLNIGDGFIWDDGTRYRVVDRWVSYDHHGRLDVGVHIWLSTHPGVDRPERTEPDYFR